MVLIGLPVSIALELATERMIRALLILGRRGYRVILIPLVSRYSIAVAGSQNTHRRVEFIVISVRAVAVSEYGEFDGLGWAAQVERSETQHSKNLRPEKHRAQLDFSRSKPLFFDF